MRTIPWATYLWPGLPQLWLRGLWWGLALAVVAAGLLDVLVLSTLVWVEWLPAWAVKLGWLGAAGLWISAAVGTVRWQAKRPPDAAVRMEALFRRAQAEYLQGDYFQAEATLTELLAINERDAEARLLLATLLRHTRRYDEADTQLRQLSRYETALRWQIELTNERACLKRLRKAARQRASDVTATSENLTEPIQLPGTSQAA